MKLGALGEAELRQQLHAGTLRLRTGPFVSCIRSDLDEVAEGVALHYAEHELGEPDGYADFLVGVERHRQLRSGLRPQVIFRFDADHPFNPLPGDQGFPMLEWGLNWCVSGLCHQYLTLHAAVLERNGRALILPAPSGSGKSTLCAGLVFSGWRLLSDELALIDPTSGWVTPLPRPVSLKNASIEVIRRFAPQVQFGRLVHETQKGVVGHFKPPIDAVQRGAERARPAWLVLPRYQSDAAPRFTALGRGRMFMRLLDNAFNYHVHGRVGFDRLGELVEQCDCLEFTYSRLEDAARLFDRLEREGASAVLDGAP